MSGIEIVGLILGTIPIVLQGLKAVNGRTSKTLFKHQHVITSFIRELDMEHIQFCNTLEKLLSGLVDEMELAQLLEDQQHSRWKDKELEKGIMKKIGADAYEAYISTIREVARLLAELGDAVRMQGKKEKWHKEIRKRLKSCIDDSKHDALIGEIRKCNQALSRLTNDTIFLEPLRMRRRTKIESKWEDIRELAKSLHQALESGWLCECSTPHLAHLRLEARSEPEEIEAKFGVIFSSASTPRGWREAEIEIITSSEEHTIEQVPKQAVPEPRSVSFSTDCGSSTLTVTGSRTRSSSLTESQPWDTRIKDLCHKLKQCSSPGYIGFLDDDHHKHYIQVFPLTSQGEGISLSDILTRNEGLRLRDKYELAVTLATSVLQLYATPWLNEHWSNKDVYFVRKRSESSPARYAYIQKAFNPPRVRAASNPELSTPVIIRPMIRNETIFALGVSLIELSLGQTLASFEMDTDLGPGGEHSLITDWLIASRLLNERIRHSEGDRYAKIVHRCINCVFEPLDPTLENAAFRQAFYDNVVVLLKEILVDFVK